MSISLEKVHFSYQPDVPILQDITFEIQRRECVLIIGRNGAGKSTLLKLLNGILKPKQGRILINGRDTVKTPTSELAKEIAVTFQNPGHQIFASAVRKEIMFGPRNLKRHNVEELTERAITLFGLGSKAYQHPYDLLPAERKLITVASAIATDASFLAFDEPSAGLSQYERDMLTDAILELRKKGHTFIVVSHDLELFLTLATKVLVISSGRIAYEGNSEDFGKEERSLRKFGVTPPLSWRVRRILEGAKAEI